MLREYQQPTVLKQKPWHEKQKCLVRLVFLPAILALLVQVAGGNAVGDQLAIRHINESPGDDLLHCLDTSTGSRTLVYQEDYYSTFSKIQCLPDQKKAETLSSVRANGFQILSSDRWTFLAPNSLFTGQSLPFKVSWKTLSVDDKIIGEPDSLQQLSSEQLDSLKSTLLGDARLIPVAGDLDAPPDVAAIHLRYSLFVHANPNKSLSLVLLLHEGDDLRTLGTYGRVIYGELANGQIKLLWDSPLLFASDLQFQDINGDGFDEIVLEGTIGWGAHGPGTQIITIFDHLGTELTRQQDCRWMNNTADFNAGPGRVCPIGGLEASLEVTEKGARIRVTGDPEAQGSGKGAGSNSTIYVLQDSHFVLSRTNVKALYPRSPH